MPRGLVGNVHESVVSVSFLGGWENRCLIGNVHERDIVFVSFLMSSLSPREQGRWAPHGLVGDVHESVVFFSILISLGHMDGKLVVSSAMSTNVWCLSPSLSPWVWVPSPRPQPTCIRSSNEMVDEHPTQLPPNIFLFPCACLIPNSLEL